MLLVVIGFPQAAITIGVIENEDAESVIMQQNVWYDDFVPAVRECVQKYNIEKTLMLGPTDYLKGLAKMIEGIVDDIEIDDGIMEEL